MENHIIESTCKGLIEKYPDQADRIIPGVNRLALFWNNSDGDDEAFINFCNTSFIADRETLHKAYTFINFEFESIHGHFNKMFLDLRRPVDLDTGKIEIIELLMSQLSPASHLTEDLFRSKVAFFIILNFRKYSIEEKAELSKDWTQEDWGYASIGDMFSSRIPSEVTQEYARLNSDANRYISGYNIYLGNLRDAENQAFFPEGLKLITHWGLRDEIKAQYSSSDGFKRQKLIYEVMKRIIDQSIPAEVIDNPDYTWNPIENRLFSRTCECPFTRENDVRYSHMLSLFKSLKKSDPYYPGFENYIQRKFELEREMKESDITGLFENLLTSPVVSQVTDLIRKRLRRELHPVDMWYDGFKSRSLISEMELDSKVKEKYPDVESFQSDLPNILQKLGFSEDQSQFVSSRIVVDPSRGAGHAWGAQMKSEKAHLRTRFQKEGLDYKGFNIAMHELGHNAEQVFSLQKVDPYVIHGVPSTSFTEAFAFVFQARDLDVLGLEKGNDLNRHLRALDLFWATFELAGVSLVDIKVWHWLYQHPEATPAELREVIIETSREVWNRYYAEHFKTSDQTILGVYSHMIVIPLYLADYPIGRIISYQIERYLEGKHLGTEMERMCSIGSISPQSWMKKAVGSRISSGPLIEDAGLAVKALEK